VEYAVGLSNVDLNLGNLIRAKGDPKGALEWFGKALRDVDNLAPAQRNDPTVYAVLRKAHWKRAEALIARGQHADAIQDWNEALKLPVKNDPNQMWLEIYRAESLARAGEHEQAIEAVEPWAAKFAKSKSASAGLPSYHVARVYALSSEFASLDMKMAADERKKRKEHYADLALESLEKARSVGFFKTSANVEKLDSPDLNAIRERPEFGKLKAEVTPKGK
jgi:tetratricopeptide (TPR) repeat protein